MNPPTHPRIPLTYWQRRELGLPISLPTSWDLPCAAENRFKYCTSEPVGYVRPDPRQLNLPFPVSRPVAEHWVVVLWPVQHGCSVTWFLQAVGRRVGATICNPPREYGSLGRARKEAADLLELLPRPKAGMLYNRDTAELVELDARSSETVHFQLG